MGKLFILFVGCLLSMQLRAGEAAVASLHFTSSETPPATVMPGLLRKHKRFIRRGFETMPEGMLLTGAAALIGRDPQVSSDELKRLSNLISPVYKQITSDPLFKNLPSALPYCFSPTRPQQGHYFLYRPEALPAEPRCIVFLHGYGGNFQFYTWVLKEAFPDAVILSPSWSMSWYGGSPVYLEEMLADAERRLGRKLSRPWLMGISGGGRGGFPIYQQLSQRFQGYICLANAPETETARRLSPGLRIRMLNGTQDEMVPRNIVHQQVGLIRNRVKDFQFQEMEADHFFLLSHREETVRILKAFLGW